MLIAWNIVNSLKSGIMGFFLMVDGIVYWLIGLLYDLYYNLAGAQIISNSTYEEIANRFLVIIGVCMLFFLTYSLLRALVNPDELNKSISKIVKNIVISLVLLSLVPTIFSYAFKIQNAIITDHVIDNLVFGNTNNTLSSVGKTTAMTFFDAFVTVSDDAEIDGYENWESLKICIQDNTVEGCAGNEGFRHIGLLASSVASGDTDYTFLISTACGCFLVYVLLSFCLDLGVRIVKLAFYQIISPIPILMQVIPEKKSVFDNWVKATIETYLEVFIRLFIMYLVAFLCSKIFHDNVISSSLGVFGTIITIMGIYAFAKQAPKLIGDILGLKGNIKLGIREKLANGGGLMAAAALGGGATSFVRNAVHGANNVMQERGFSNRARAFGRGLLSSGAGLVSGAARGGYNARNAHNYADVRNASNNAVQSTVNARNNREAYRTNHPGRLGPIRGHISDVGQNISNYIGLETPLEQLRVEQTQAQEVQNARKAIDDRLKSIMERDAARRMATQAVDIKDEQGNVIASYKNLAELENAKEILKSGGNINGVTATASLLREFDKQEGNLKKQLKKDILNGYDVNGNQLTSEQFATKYDGNLQELLTTYRTKSLQRANVIASNASDDEAVQNSLSQFREQAINHQDVSLNDFVRNGFADELVNNSKNVIDNANMNININMNQRAQEQRNNSNNRNNS